MSTLTLPLNHRFSWELVGGKLFKRWFVSTRPWGSHFTYCICCLFSLSVDTNALFFQWLNTVTSLSLTSWSVNTHTQFSLNTHLICFNRPYTWPCVTCETLKCGSPHIYLHTWTHISLSVILTQVSLGIRWSIIMHVADVLRELQIHYCSRKIKPWQTETHADTHS